MDLLQIDGDSSQRVSENGDCVVCRARCLYADSNRGTVLVVRPASEHPAPVTLDRLTHAYSLRDELGESWAVRPLQLVRDRGQIRLVLEDPGGAPLDRLLGAPTETGRFLNLAIGIASALGKLSLVNADHP